MCTGEQAGGSLLPAMISDGISAIPESCQRTKLINPGVAAVRHTQRRKYLLLGNIVKRFFHQLFNHTLQVLKSLARIRKCAVRSEYKFCVFSAPVRQAVSM